MCVHVYIHLFVVVVFYVCVCVCAHTCQEPRVLRACLIDLFFNFETKRSLFLFCFLSFSYSAVLHLSVCSPPPALPPKKRQSAPSPTPVAVVAPMSRGSSLPCSDHRQVRL